MTRGDAGIEVGLGKPLMEKSTFNKFSDGPQTACSKISNCINNTTLPKLHIYLPAVLSGNFRCSVFMQCMCVCVRVCVCVCVK